MPANTHPQTANVAALINTLPTRIEGIRLSAQVSMHSDGETLRELDHALSVAWIAAARLAAEHGDGLIAEPSTTFDIDRQKERSARAV